jgi:carboxyl-terminal processing protease
MKKQIKLLILFASSIIIFSFFLIFHQNASDIPGKTDLHLFKTILDLTRTDYVDKISPKDKVPAAHSVFLKNLDPASSYLEPREALLYTKFQNLANLCAVGIFGIKIKDYFQITKITGNSPAQRAGIHPGDRILSVNNQDFQNFSFWQMFLSLYSINPRLIKITILKKDTNKPKNISLQTDVSPKKNNAVSLGKGNHIFSILRYNGKTLAEIQKLTNDDSLNCLILDLRLPAAGDFLIFKKIADLILPTEILVTEKSRDDERILGFGSNDSKKIKTIAIINNSTTMYNEFLAYLLKAASVKIVGQNSGGILTRTQEIHFPDSSMAVISSAYYYINQSKISNTPLKPDLAIELDKEEELRKKIGHLLNNGQ